MEFWASSETYLGVDARVEAIRRLVEPKFNDLISHSPLAYKDVRLRYVPIVMPPHLEDRYPERSKARLKQRILDCAPQLNYSIFKDENAVSCLKEYIRGIRTARPLLLEFALSQDDIDEFESIIDALQRQLIASVELP